MKGNRRMMNDIFKEIEKAEIVSFDVFDTLIMRKTLYPEDVFDIVQRKAERLGISIQDFKNLRKRADDENPYILPTIFQIYDHLSQIGNIGQTDKETLLKLELAAEKEVLILRRSMKEILDFAVKKGKRVHLISDMYLTREHFQEILEELGIKGYEDIWVSCEHKESKRGGLFKTFKNEIAGETYLHIGDNLISDGESARAAGIRTYEIKSALDILKESAYKEILDEAETLEDRMLIGLSISRIFNNPFLELGEDGRPAIEDGMTLIYGFAAPLISCFMTWFVNKIKQGEYNKILFAARDGWMVQQLYEIYKDISRKDMPEGIYFRTSRTLCAAAAMDSEWEICQLSRREFTGEMEDMIKRRFLLDESQILPYQNCNGITREEYALQHKEQIYQKSAQIQKEYLEYMKKLGLRQDEKYGMFDFVSSGTSQYFLNKIVPFQIEGLYFCWYQRHDNYAKFFNQLKIDALKKDECENYETGNYFLHYLWMESIFTSFEPSISGITQEDFVYDTESRTDDELSYVKQMQDTVIEYFTDYLTSVVELNENQFSSKTAERLFSFIDLNFTDDRSELFSNIHLKDDFDQNIMSVRR